MSKKIKIVYFIDTFNLAGAEKLLLEICKKIDHDKFAVNVAAVVRGGPLEAEFNKLNIPVKIFNKKSKLGLILIWQLYKYLKELKPDIVHTHLFGGDTWGRIAAIFARVPLIISTEHNINLPEGSLKKKIKLILSVKTDKIIAVSQGVKDYSVKTEKIKSDKITVIYNGIDLAEFKFRGYQPIDLNKEIKAIVLARLEKQKGHQYLIEAMPLILNKYPNFKLNIIGEGSLEQDLKQQVEKLGLNDKVVFWGKRFDVEEIMQRMDIFVLPSLWEGLGVALIETLAVGLPVITSNIPGSDEVIKDEQTGLLFAPKNPEAIFKSIDKLLQNPKINEKIVINGHAFVQKRFSLQQMVTSYEELYLNLIEKYKVKS